MRVTGYIKVFRDLLDHEIMASDWPCRLWLWCMLRANHKPRTYRGELINRGQFVTGRNTGADQLKVSPSKFYRGLKQLESIGCISLKVNSNWTTVTVCKYSTYQDRKNKSEQPVTHSVAHSLTQQVDSKRTSGDTTSEQRMNTNKNGRIKECKEGKEINTLSSLGSDKKNYPELFEQFWNAYPKRNGIRQHKVTTFKLWKALATEDRELLVPAATHYAASDEAKRNYACDPDKFVRHAMWHDWQAPAGQQAEEDLPPLVVGPDFNYVEWLASAAARGQA